MKLRLLGCSTALIASLLGCKHEPAAARRTSPAAAATEAAAKALKKAYVPAQSPWASRAACFAELARRQPRQDVAPRIATWNVRYFPDGVEVEEEGEARSMTDLEWLACAIALLDLDVLAVQEFKKTARAASAADTLVTRLRELTGRHYRLLLAECEPNEVQHPGLLYDEQRVRARFVRDVPELNPAKACTNAASPGFAAYLSFEQGPDFHLMVVHAYAGNTRHGHEKRRGFVDALERTTARLVELVADRDIVVTGDFNTSGCADCAPAVAGDAETQTLAERLPQFAVPLRLVPSSEPCTFAPGREPALLDHFLVSASMQEAPSDVRGRVSGYCQALHCDSVLTKPSAAKTLSDHCPVVLELASRDLD